MRLWEQFDRMVVFDTETTGIDFGKDRIIEIGAVSLEMGRRPEAWTSSSACRRGGGWTPSSQT